MSEGENPPKAAIYPRDQDRITAPEFRSTAEAEVARLFFDEAEVTKLIGSTNANEIRIVQDTLGLIVLSHLIGRPEAEIKTLVGKSEVPAGVDRQWMIDHLTEPEFNRIKSAVMTRWQESARRHSFPKNNL